MGYCDEWSHDPIKCNNESFRKPMPWIGIYVAAASAICSFAMAVDAVRGVRSRKLWFPCKFFTLNAASLTLLAIAVKLPMDLNSPMPGSFDQFSKLSGVIFMATSMANFMPSLGVMGSKGVLMNMTALGILVITLLVNVSIQLGTGLIFSFTCEHVLVICFTFILFWMMSCSALVVPTTKKILERKYHEISKMISAESVEGGGIEILKEDVRKYWLMAESSNPQFVMVRSPTCFASSAISCLSAIVLCEAFVRSFFFDKFSGNVNFFMGKRSSSDYQATTSVIVFIQSASIVLGTLAPLFRCLIAIKIKISGGGESCGSVMPEKYWTQRQMEWIERPLPLQIGGGRYFKKAINKSKDMAICFCIKVQIATVVACKIVQLFCLAFVRPLLSWFLEHKLNCSQDRDAGCYVLHLEGEDQLPQVMAKNNNVLSRFIQNGINQKPQQLVKLLQKMTDNFFGVTKFDSTQVHSLNSQEPPNCWKLPIVTLTSIAIALPHSSCVKEVENLVCSVSQGLKYVSIMDEVLGTGGAFKKVRDAADVAWSEVSLSGRFLNKDLTEMARNKANTSREIIAKLCEIARDYVKESGSLANDCSHWPNKVIAANSMYRITQSLLLELKSYNELSTEELFGHISVMIADILGACLTNLSKAITTKCSTVSIDKRGETVQDMARVIGETEEILRMLQKNQLPSSLAPKQRIDIDEWRHLLVGMSPLVSSSLLRGHRASTTSVELQVCTDNQF